MNSKKSAHVSAWALVTRIGKSHRNNTQPLVKTQVISVTSVLGVLGLPTIHGE